MASKIYQVTNGGINATILMSNTMYIGGALTPTLTLAEINAGLGAIRTFYDALKSFAPSSQTWQVGARVLEIDYGAPATPPVIMGTTPPAIVAGTGGVQTINQAAVCIAWRTALAGRSYRGRTFYGALAATVVAGGVIGSGTVSSFNTAANALVTNLFALATPLHLWCYSRKLGTVERINSGITDSLPDVLRSRKR